MVSKLKMRPVTYTYDRGIVTDRWWRNISRMCAKLGAENIIIAEAIARKHEYVRWNIRAWLKSPYRVMTSILTSGDK